MGGITSEQMKLAPYYRCHKKVWALKIRRIVLHPLQEEFIGRVDLAGVDAVIVPERWGFEPFAVTDEFILKHSPAPGGYFVLYEDGYFSYSPAKAFEEGYTEIE